MNLYESLAIVLGLGVVVYGILSAVKIGYNIGKGEDVGDQFKSFKDVEMFDPDEIPENEKLPPIEKLMEEEDGEED